jgi:cobalt-precorrin-5B (C1)-methyltransferase
LAGWVDDERLHHANTALQAYEIAGERLAIEIANRAQIAVQTLLKGAPVTSDIVMIDRKGTILARAGM